jgi:hypothetical protein
MFVREAGSKPSPLGQDLLCGPAQLAQYSPQPLPARTWKLRQLPTAAPAPGRLAATSSTPVTKLSADTTTGSEASRTHTLRDTALAHIR